MQCNACANFVKNRNRELTLKKQAILGLILRPGLAHASSSPALMASIISWTW